MPRTGTETEAENDSLENDNTEVETETNAGGSASDDNEKEESPEESARIALAELQAGRDASGDQDAEPENTSGAAQGTSKESVAPKADAEVAPTGEKIDPLDYEPPSRLSDTEKKLFNKLPKQFRPAVARMFKDHQRNESRRAQEYQAATQESRAVIEAVRPYYLQNPELAENGITESGFITALVGAHMKLTHEKEITRWKTVEGIARDAGFTIQRVNENGEKITQPNSAVTSDIKQHPDFVALQNEVQSLRSERTSERVNAIAAPVISEFERIRDQKDPTGTRYLRPELHEESFWIKARPLISQLTNEQGYKPGDALIEAHRLITRRTVPGSTAVRPTSETNINNRAVSAGVSVRGRVAPTATRIAAGAETEVSDDETPEQSALIALQDLRRGMN